MSSRTSRVMLVLAFLALTALAATLALISMKRRLARKETELWIDQLVEEQAKATSPTTPAELFERSKAQLDLATRALDHSPDCPKAHALAALALARLGDWRSAEDHLGDAGDSELARHARAWVLSLGGDTARGTALFGTSAEERHEAASIRYLDGQPNAVRENTPVDFDETPLLEREWDWLLRVHEPFFRGRIERRVDEIPGTLEAHRLRLVLATVAFVANDDARASSLLATLHAAAPLVRRWAEALEARVALADRGDALVFAPYQESSPEALFLPSLCERELDVTEKLLDQAGVLDRDDLRATAIRRALRYTALVPSPPDEPKLRVLERALAQRASTNAKLLLEIAKREPSLEPRVDAALHPERARAQLVSLDVARDVFVITGPRAADEEDDWLERAYLADLLDRPWSALDEVERLDAIHPDMRKVMVARARAKTDPLGAFVALALQPQTFEPAKVDLARWLMPFLPDSSDGCLVLLASRKLEPDQIARGLELFNLAKQELRK